MPQQQLNPIDGEALIAKPPSLEPLQAAVVFRYPEVRRPNNVISIILPELARPLTKKPASSKKIKKSNQVGPKKPQRPKIPEDLARIVGIKHKLVVLYPVDFPYKDAREIIFRVVVMDTTQVGDISRYDMSVNPDKDVILGCVKTVDYCYYEPENSLPPGIPAARLILLYDRFLMEEVQTFTLGMDEYKRYSKNGPICVEVKLHNYSPPRCPRTGMVHWLDLAVKRPECPERYRLRGNTPPPKTPKTDSLFRAVFKDPIDDALTVE